MVSRAVSTHSNSTSPSRTSASAECSSCVLPRKRAQLLGAPSARLAGLLKRSLPSARVWSAPSTSRPGIVAATASRLGARQQARHRGGIGTTGSRFHRALVDLRRPDLEAQARRRREFCRAHRFSTRAPAAGGRAKAASCFTLTGWRRRSLNSRITAAAVSSIERRVTSMRRPVVLGAEPARKRHFLGHRRLVDILIVVAMRLQTEQPVLADLHDALGAGIEPDHQRPGQHSRPPAQPARPAPAAHCRS